MPLLPPLCTQHDQVLIKIRPRLYFRLPHALGGLAGSRRTLLHMQQRCSGDQGEKVMTVTSWPPSWKRDVDQKSTTSINVY